MQDYVALQLESVRNKIAETAVAAGRDPATVKLVAVTKTFPPETIISAYNAGQRLFGENRVQELEGKVPAMPADIRWHLIGHLQTNKVRKAVEMAELIHSVDSERLLCRIDAIACELGKRQRILLELNISGEGTKFGLRNEADVLPLAEKAFSMKNVELCGLMTMAPYEVPSGELTRIFSSTRRIRDAVNERFGCSLPELSMGMSSDFEAAISEGATLVRIGTAIFGRR